jgi:hypothetical protein
VVETRDDVDEVPDDCDDWPTDFLDPRLVQQIKQVTRIAIKTTTPATTEPMTQERLHPSALSSCSVSEPYD